MIDAIMIVGAVIVGILHTINDLIRAKDATEQRTDRW